MRRLRDRIQIDLPLDETQPRIDAYFESLRGAGGVATVRLRVPIKGTGAALGLSIEREVCIEARNTRDDNNLNDVVRVAWRAEGSSLFPEFKGVLVVWAEADPQRSFVEIDGEYKPPLGMTGEIFDAIAGVQIAKSTAREFLNDLKRAVERSTA